MHGVSLIPARPRAARAALAGLCVLLLSLSVPAQVRAWSEFGTTVEKPVAADEGLEIREPFFAFLLGMVDADSLGEWTGAEVRDYAAARGNPSRFPLDELVSLSRSLPDNTVAVRYSGARVQAVWRILLTGPQDRPMPYSILGYHPGSLRIGAEMVLSELAAVDLSLGFVLDGEFVEATVTEARVFALERGYVVLDADGWLDALLGAALDDAWTLGFVTGVENGRLVGLGVSVGREDRHIYGEFDFTKDKVLAHGRPLASALSRASRTWLNVDDGNLPPPWVEP